MKSFLGRQDLPRGLRNNNPGNIIITNINWSGEIPLPQNTDGHFEQFYSVEKGIRAAAMDIIHDVKNGQDTIRKLITEWAPPVENATTDYINYVASGTGQNPDAPIQLNAETLKRILRVIVNVENGPAGQTYVSDYDIENSIMLLPEAILAELGAFVKKQGPVIATLFFFAPSATEFINTTKSK